MQKTTKHSTWSCIVFGRYIVFAMRNEYLHSIRCFPSLRNEKRHCCYNIITTISHVISSEGIHGTEKYVWSGLLLFLKIPEIHLDSHFKVSEWTSTKWNLFVLLSRMLRRYWRHVAMQANHWRHPHFRWRCVLSLDVLLMIIIMHMCLKVRFIVKDYKTLWNIDFSFVSMMTRLLSHRTIFPGSSIYRAYRSIFKRNTAFSMITID